MKKWLGLFSMFVAVVCVFFFHQPVGSVWREDSIPSFATSVDKEVIASRKFIAEVLPSTTLDEQVELNRKLGLGCANMGFPVYDSVTDKSWIIFGDSFGGVDTVWKKYYRCNVMLGFDMDKTFDDWEQDGVVTFDSFYSDDGIMSVDEHIARFDNNEGQNPTNLKVGAGNYPLTNCVGFNSWDSTALIHGHYQNLSSHPNGIGESSKIPTGAIEVNGNLYMFYFSKTSSVNGTYQMNYGGCIKSTDHGDTWTKVNQLSWADHASGVVASFQPIGQDGERVVMANGNSAENIKKLIDEDIHLNPNAADIDISEHEGYFFTQIWPVDGHDGFIYLLGEGGYRDTGVKLARVRKENFENFDAYEYFIGLGDDGNPTWEKGSAGLKKLNAMGDVGYIFGSDKLYDEGSGCGELSCAYNPYLGKWMVSYLRSTKAGKGGIKYRLAENLWGPWSEPQSLFRYGDARLLPKDRDGNPIYTIYGGIIFDKWMKNNGQTIYILVAQWKKATEGSNYVVYRSSMVEINFNKINYTVKFYPNGGEGKKKSQAFSYGTAQKLKENTFSREEYDFVGWNTQADGEGVMYADEAEVNNLTNIDGKSISLYAIWQPKEPIPVVGPPPDEEETLVEGDNSAPDITQSDNERSVESTADSEEVSPLVDSAEGSADLVAEDSVDTTSPPENSSEVEQSDTPPASSSDSEGVAPPTPELDNGIDTSLDNEGDMVEPNPSEELDTVLEGASDPPVTEDTIEPSVTEDEIINLDAQDLDIQCESLSIEPNLQSAKLIDDSVSVSFIAFCGVVISSLAAIMIVGSCRHRKSSHHIVDYDVDD